MTITTKNVAALECEEHGHQIVASDADPENGTEELHCERCGFTDTARF